MLWTIQRKAPLLLPIPQALRSGGQAKAGGLLLTAHAGAIYLLCTHHIHIRGSCAVQTRLDQGPRAKLGTP